jgi:hypothetical protein
MVRISQMSAPTINFSLTATPQESQGDFRREVMSLSADALDDCLISVFFVSDSYAIFNGEIVSGEHASSTRALHDYLEGTLVAKTGAHLNLDVKIESVN